MKCLPNPASQINKKIVTQTCALYTKAELHVTRDMLHFHFTGHLKLLSKLIVHLLYLKEARPSCGNYGGFPIGFSGYAIGRFQIVQEQS